MVEHANDRPRSFVRPPLDRSPPPPLVRGARWRREEAALLRRRLGVSWSTAPPGRILPYRTTGAQRTSPPGVRDRRKNGEPVRPKLSVGPGTDPPNLSDRTPYGWTGSKGPGPPAVGDGRRGSPRGGSISGERPREPTVDPSRDAGRSGRSAVPASGHTSGGCPAPRRPFRRLLPLSRLSRLFVAPGQDVRQPVLDRDTDFVRSGNRYGALDAGRDIAGETDVGSKGLGRPLFHPGPDDEQPRAGGGHPGPAAGASARRRSGMPHLRSAMVRRRGRARGSIPTP